jgi:serine/threonine protein phosphatase PrpC
MTNLDIGQKTDRGLNPDRPINEDSMGVFHKSLANSSFVIAVVADGMGGMDRGDDASRAAVELLQEVTPTANDLATPEAFADWFVGTAAEANSAVRSALGHAQGGCTLTQVAFLNDTFVLAHVGDSRAYLRSSGEVVRITNDHSLVALLVANGEMTEEEAEVSEERNAILRSLGSHDRLPEGWTDDLSTRRVLADSSGVEPARYTNLLPGEVLVLVSDGVWGVVPSAEFNGIVNSRIEAQAMANELVAAALRHGAPDNATAVVIRQTAADQGLQRLFLTNQSVSQKPPAALAPALAAPSNAEPIVRSAAGSVVPVTKVMTAQPTLERASARRSKALPLAAAGIGVLAAGVLGFFALWNDSKKPPMAVSGSEVVVSVLPTEVSTSGVAVTEVVSVPESVVVETSVVSGEPPVADGVIVSSVRGVPSDEELSRDVVDVPKDLGSLEKEYSDTSVKCYSRSSSPYAVVECDEGGPAGLGIGRVSRVVVDKVPELWVELVSPPPSIATTSSSVVSNVKPRSTSPEVAKKGATTTEAVTTTTKKTTTKKQKTITTKKPKPTTSAVPATEPVATTASTTTAPQSAATTAGEISVEPTTAAPTTTTAAPTTTTTTAAPTTTTAAPTTTTAAPMPAAPSGGDGSAGSGADSNLARGS